MAWLTPEGAREAAKSSRKVHPVEVPELGATVGFLEATGAQLIALDAMTPGGVIPYGTMHTILPAVVVSEDGVPLFPGSELVAELPGRVIEALMREWLKCNGIAGPPPTAPAPNNEPRAVTPEDGLAKRDQILEKMRSAGHPV